MGHKRRGKPKRLAEKLLAVRRKLGTSQSQLAKLLDLINARHEFPNMSMAPAAGFNHLAEIRKVGPRIDKCFGR
jgi:hypothetical protein